MCVRVQVFSTQLGSRVLLTGIIGENVYKTKQGMLELPSNQPSHACRVGGRAGSLNTIEGEVALVNDQKYTSIKDANSREVVGHR